MIKTLRQKQRISQEELADLTGLSLRTIQRAEGKQRISDASMRSLAAFFEVSVETLEQEEPTMANEESKTLNFLPQNLTYHRSAQLIIFIIAFFICVSQWLGYYARITPETSSDASLWTILFYISMIAVGAALFTYIFNMAKVTFYWSYYITSGVFLVSAIALSFWTQEYSDSASYLLYYPVLYTIFLLALCTIHILQLALSLKAESTVYVPK